MEVTDANVGSAIPVESSTTEGQATVQESIPGEEQSAETLNTDAEPENESHVPYNRFKEVNEERKRYKEEIEAMAELKQFSEALEKDPELAKKLEEAIQEYSGMNEEQAVLPDEDRIAKLESRLQSKEQEEIFKSYQSEFKDLVKDVPETQKEILFTLTSSIAATMHKDPYTQHVPGLVENAYKKAKEQVDKIVKTGQAELVDEKISDSVPTSVTGSPVKEDVKLENQEDRSRVLSNMLKTMKK